MAEPSPDQYAATKASWAKVKGNQVEILAAVFKANPDIQAKFTAFAGKNVDDIKGTPEFKDYAVKILGFLDTVMNALGDDSKVLAGAKQLAATHKTRATAGQFDNFQKSFMVYLKGAAGIDGATEASWKAVLDFVFTILKRELQNA